MKEGRRELRLLDLMMTGIGGLVGSGWLFSSLTAANVAGPGAIISWVIGMVAIAIIGLTFAELAGLVPEMGGVIRYPEISHGSLTSFLIGWAVLISYAGLAPIEAEGVLQYAATYVPGLYNAGSSTLTTVGFVVAAALVVSFFVVNYFGVKLYARINSNMTWVKLVVPSLTAILLLVSGFHAGNFTQHGGFLPKGWTGVFSAISTGGIIFTFTGFRTMFDMAGEAKNPRRDMSRALFLALGFVGVLYILLQLAFIGALPGSDLSHGWANVALTSPFANLAMVLNMSWLAIILYGDAIVSPMGTGFVYAAVFPRSLFAFAKNGYFWPVLKRLNRYGTPGAAMGISVVVGILFLLPFPSWQKMVSILSSATILTYMIGPISAAALRKSAPDARRPYRVRGLGFLGPIGFVVGSLIFYWSGWDINRWMMGLLGFGIVIYFAYGVRKMNRPWDDVKSGIWLLVYFVAMFLMERYGSANFGGENVIPTPWDQAIVAAISLIFYYWGVSARKTLSQTDQNALSMVSALDADEASEEELRQSI
ncbi:APC family permease [Sulfobacillus harzensis]|uniref:APC family permease n=1 Tax=Sulfobacillus harzensis TaxID=2729629 RepID=A0A7Y0Q3N0_9FIRM|nr:APC family permease [Sulfobacillus harzensis]NMP23161.1 APC family permease [Sulfobacillus harzensis]